MPGPKYNYFNIRDELKIAPEYSGSILFGDSDLSISSSADGSLAVNADTGVAINTTTVTLNGNTTLTTGDTFTVVDGAVNLGTGALTLGGDATLSTGINLNYNANDSVAASGLQGSMIWSGAGVQTKPNAWPSAQGWIRVDIGGMQGYIPVYSGNLLKAGAQP